jgi:hypothetical protein
MNALVNQVLAERGVKNLLITSHSIDATFDSCARRFEFIHGWRRLPQRESSTYAADVGTALHEAVQQWARTESADEGALRLLRYWPWSDERIRRAESKQIGQRTLGNSVLMYDRIISHEWWNDWELVYIKGFGHAIEVPFLIVHESLGIIKLPNGDLALLATQGKIDFILRHRRTRKYKVLDLKTTVKDVPAHNASFRFSDQAGLYALVLDKALDSSWEKDGLSVTYMVAYFGSDEADMQVIPLDYDLPPYEVQDLIDVKMERLIRMRTYAEHQRWPRRSHGCEFFGTPCGFLDICQKRDSKFLKEWFAFDLATGDKVEYERHYEPAWIVFA